jgi:hypothetical protein
VPPQIDSHSGLIAEASAGITWVSGAVRWTHVVIPAAIAVLGVGCVAAGNVLAVQTTFPGAPLWWFGVLAIFVPVAAMLLYVELSRNEAIALLLVVAMALFAVKLLYAPGALSGYDEMLHYRTVDGILTTRHLFAENTLLPVSPFYPGMETVTATIVQLTGLSIIQAGIVLIGVARMLTIIALFLLFERIAMPSRFAAPATLLYMAGPAFLYFDSMFSYESLALALALACLLALRAAQLEEGSRRDRLNAVAAILLLAVTVTHHVTSFILVATLVAWTLVELGHAMHVRSTTRRPHRRDARALRRRVYFSDLPGSGWVPLLGIFAVLGWLLNVAGITVSYLLPQLTSGFVEVVRIIRMEGTGRKLFESTTGYTTPLFERIVAIGSVLLILALIPIGMRYLWKRRRYSVVSRFLAVGALAYPAILALRFTESGWAVGQRATAFVYIPLAFTLAAGIEVILVPDVRHRKLRTAAVLVAMSIIFAGGIIAGSSPLTRQPSTYDPGVAEVPYDGESLAAARWAADTLGPAHRVAADNAQGALVGGVGRQETVSSGNGFSLSQFFLSPSLDSNDRAMIQSGHIDYVLVDRRISGTPPRKGFIYEWWERQVRDYGSSVSSETVNKFESIRDASKVFDSGNIQFFDVHRLAP